MWSVFLIIFGFTGLCLSIKIGFIPFSIGVPSMMIGLGLYYGVRKNIKMFNKGVSANLDTAAAESK
jgi:hypothetical protein